MSRLYLILSILIILLLSYSATAKTIIPNNYTVFGDTVWTDTMYVVQGTMSIDQNGTLTISRPGTKVMFASILSFDIHGKIIANGTSTQHIIFTSIKDTLGGNPQSGDWGRIFISPSDNNRPDSCVFNYCEIKYGGGYGGSALMISNCKPKITNSRITKSKEHGVIVQSTSVYLNNCIIDSCDKDGIYIEDYKDVGVSIDSTSIKGNKGYGVFSKNSTGIRTIIITNSVIAGNEKSGIYTFSYLNNDTLLFSNNLIKDNGRAGITTSFATISNNTIQQPNNYGIEYTGNIKNGCIVSNNNITDGHNGAFAISGEINGTLDTTACNGRYIVIPDINNGASLFLDTLTIKPGVILKFKQGMELFLDSGNILIAKGSSSLPIIFTSFLDDSAGGDTEPDSTTPPQPGDWKGINVRGYAKILLDHCIIKYGGGASEGANLYLANVDTISTITNSTITKSYRDGIYIGGTTPKMYNIEATYNLGNGLYIGGGKFSIFNSNLSKNAGAGVESYSSSFTLSSCIIDSNNIGVNAYPDNNFIQIINSQISRNKLYGIYFKSYDGSSYKDTLLVSSSKVKNNNGNGIEVVGDLYDNISFRNCYISNNLGIGINSPRAIFDSDTLVNNGYALGLMGYLGTGNVYMGSNVIQNNGQNNAFVLSGEQQNGYIEGTLKHYPNDYGVFIVKQQYLTIATNKQLIIPAGSIIKFDTTNNSIEVYGSLIADGTPLKPIIFTTKHDTIEGGTSSIPPKAGDWSGIQFYQTSGNSIINNCYINYADVGIIIESNLKVTNCKITNSKVHAIYIGRGNPEIEGNIISYNNSGIYSGGKTTIRNNTIFNNLSSYAIYCVDTTYIYNNRIIQNYYGIGTCVDKVVIKNNDISGNLKEGLYNYASSCVVADSNWWGNSTGPKQTETVSAQFCGIAPNPLGLGDGISGYVNFRPWRTSAVFPDTNEAIPPIITFYQYNNVVQNSDTSITIFAMISDVNGISKALVYYAPGGSKTFSDSVQMSGTFGTFTATISKDWVKANGSKGLLYKVVAYDNSKKKNRGETPIRGSELRNVTASTSSLPTDRYILFSIPIIPDWEQPEGGVVDSAYSFFADDFGTQTDSTFRIFGLGHYYDRKKANSIYSTKRDTIKLDSIHYYYENPEICPGFGYWLHTKVKGNVDITGTSFDPSASFSKLKDTETNLLQYPFYVHLFKGWNFIGCPFDFEVSWKNVYIHYRGIMRNFAIFDSVLNNNYVRQYFYTYYDTDSWTGPVNAPLVNEVMKPWHGYAIYSLVDGAMIMIYPNSYQSKLLATENSQQITNNNPVWSLELQAESQGYIDKGNIIGISPLSNDGYDRWDIEKPLQIGTTSVYFPHRDWGKDANIFSIDYRSNDNKDKKWNMEVKSLNKGETITLRWQKFGNIPDGWNLYLIDKDKRLAINLNEHSEYSFISSDGARKFEIQYTNSNKMYIPDIPNSFALSQNHPNPFNPETVINYQLPTNCKVSMKIYNTLGQLVRTLVDNELQESGYYSIKWNGKDDRYKDVSSGVYFYTIEAVGYKNDKSYINTKKAILLK